MIAHDIKCGKADQEKPKSAEGFHQSILTASNILASRSSLTVKPFRRRFPSDVNAATGKNLPRGEVANVSLLVSTQQKHMEVERTAKWLKMMKSWDKYKNSEKVIFCFPVCLHISSSSLYPFILTSICPSPLGRNSLLTKVSVSRLTAKSML